MKNPELIEKITELLTENKSLTPQEMAYKVDGSPPVIQVHNVLAKMKQSGTIKETISDRAKYYSLVAAEPKAVSPSRNLLKFSFDGKSNLSKGRLALTIVQRYVREVKISSADELLNTFPNHIVTTYGVFKSYKEAVEMSQKRKRYFINEEDVIELKDGSKLCVTNQWTLDRISALLEVAEKELSYKIGRK